MLRIGIDAVYCDNVDRMVTTVAEWTTGGPHFHEPRDAR